MGISVRIIFLLAATLLVGSWLELPANAAAKGRPHRASGAARAGHCKVLAVVGMRDEANIIRENFPDHEVDVASSDGGNTEALWRELRYRNPSDYCAVVSYGVGGGLNRRLRPGDIVVPKAIVTDRGSIYPTSSRLTSEMLRQLGRSRTRGGSRVTSGVWVGTQKYYSTPESKAWLAWHTGAEGADMESGPVVTWLHQNKSRGRRTPPFGVVRSIVDTANDRVESPFDFLGLAGPYGEALDGLRRHTPALRRALRAQ